MFTLLQTFEDEYSRRGRDGIRKENNIVIDVNDHENSLCKTCNSF